MKVPKGPGHRSRSVAIGLVMALLFGTAGVVVGEVINGVEITTPKHADDITNIDILRREIKNYYGTPNASTGSAPGAGWTLPLNLDSNYAIEARSVAASGRHFLNQHSEDAGNLAIVLDVDDTTLTTYNYELYSNWDFNPVTNGQFVTDQLFPATPGMVRLVRRAHNLGYSVFFLTGRPQAQEAATLGNLTSDGIGVDAGYVAPDEATAGVDGLFTKPAVGSYPSYLDKPEFCGPSITNGVSCPTILYKSGVRAYIESLGYTIVGNFGDQYSDLIGGFSLKTFKMPNPNYFLP